MWVVYRADTGMEIDRVESREIRDNLIEELSRPENNLYEFTYTYRWED